MEQLALPLGLLALVFAVLWLRLMSRQGELVSTLAVAQAKADSLDASRDFDLERARSEAELRHMEKVVELKEQFERERVAERSDLRAQEDALRSRSLDVDARAREAEVRVERAEQGKESLSKERSQLEKDRAALIDEREVLSKELAALSSLSKDEARSIVLQRAEAEARADIAKKLKEIEAEVRGRAEASAKKVIALAIQRYAGDYTCERTVSVVPLASDDLKGRIIGREGRNIRALEAATGVDIIIDDTPECVVVSAYNPIRREVAKRAIEVLLEDGRVHPTRVEAVVRKAEFDFHRVIRAAGDQAAHEVGIQGIHPEVLKLVGALKYRTSYGQNQWQHALEVAFLSGIMASELGLDEQLARRAGLLHDIGKVMDQTAEGSHALIGAEFARKHGEADLVVNAIASHHEEVEQRTVYDVLVQAADAISGARPGARREMAHAHSQRLESLERIANSFPGVARSYAVQAGREIRVLVENSVMSDDEAVLLSHDIARRIEGELNYPGQVKVTVIRETRIVQYAR